MVFSFKANRIFTFQLVLSATLIWPAFSFAQENTNRPLPLPLEEVRMFTEALERIRASYVEEVDDRTLLENAIRGMLSGLDPHSAYIVENEYDALQETTTGEFGGLGIEVGREEGYIKVISPIDDTPADKAGIKKGDVIVNCGGSAASNLETVQKRVRRTKVGEQLHLELRRGAHAKVSAAVKLGEAERVVRTAAKAKMAAEQQHRSSVPHGFFMMG